MKQRKMFARLAAVMTAVLLAMTAAPALAAEGSVWEDEALLTQFSKDDARTATPSVTFRIQQDIVELKDRVRTIRPVDEEYEGAPDGGMIGGTLTFYVSRDVGTNQLIFPDSAVITVTQESGDAIGPLEIQASEAMKTLLEVSVENDGELSADSPVRFIVSLNEDWDGLGTVNNGSLKNYVMVAGPDGSPCWKIRVLYGADGPRTEYSAMSGNRYDGMIIDTGDGDYYVNVADIDLNGTEAPSFTIRHHFGYYADMKDVWIESAKLNPDGLFTFEDGTTGEKKLSTDAASGIVLIPMKMKQDVFEMCRDRAVSEKNEVQSYEVMSDLVITYTDGYEAGGVMHPLPLVYCITYSPPSGGEGSGGSGGSGGGGGSSGGSGGSATSGVTVSGPAVTPRTTVAAAVDVGWILKDGAWYYMDAANQPVTDWLLGPDGRWYFLGPDGVMKTGWIQLGATWYFLNADGAMATGWLQLGTTWYFLNPDGSMATGWIQNTDGKWYYLFPNGAMAVNIKTPDGYQVDDSGAWVR